MSSFIDYLLRSRHQLRAVSPRDGLLRDLEALLNTRSEAGSDLAEEFPEVRRSLYTYGLPDLTSFDPDRVADRRRMQQALAQALATFEPRLDRVQVHEPILETNRTLRFPIEAVFLTEHQPEPVRFDTVLRLDTNTYAVKEQH